MNNLGKIQKKNTKEIEKIKRNTLPLLKKNNVKRAGIFGSYARGDNTKNSDIDILVEITNKNFSLFDLVKLKLHLKEKLKKEIDLIEYSALHPLIKKEALKEEIRIL